MATQLFYHLQFSGQVPVLKMRVTMTEGDVKVKERVKLSLCISWMYIVVVRYGSTPFYLDTRWRLFVSFMPQPPYPLGDIPPCPLHIRMSGSQCHLRRTEGNISP
jgi:hypothetical protein